jgi:hypothetical protein
MDGRSVSTLEAVVDDWLHASLNTGDVVSHGIHASLGGVDLDDVLQLGLAALELVLPELALGLAIFNQQVFWVFTFLQHLLHIAYRGLEFSIKRNIKALDRSRASVRILPGVAMWGASLGSG